MRADRARSRAKRRAHPHRRTRLAHAGEGEARDVCGKRRDARHPSRDPRHRNNRRRSSTPFYGADCPAAVVVQASAPEQRILRGTLADIAAKVAAARIERTALILVGRALAAENFRDSALYDADYRRRFRGGAASVIARSEATTLTVSYQTARGRPEAPSRSNSTISIATSRPATTRSAVAFAARATSSPSAMPSALRQRKGFRGGVGSQDARAQVRPEPPAACAKLRQQRVIDRAALGMQIGEALRELGHLADAAGDGDARQRMRAHIFEHAADEIAHVDQRDLRQAVEFLHRGFRTGPGRAGDVSDAGGARDIDAAMDRMDPGRAGIRHDDPGGAEDRQAADNAEPAVERLGGERCAAGNGDLDLGVGGVGQRRRRLRRWRRGSCAAAPD